eukprot:scaffold4411_cov61-Skeletonema_dohrnii-CCMP3373.AAC.1
MGMQLLQLKQCVCNLLRLGCTSNNDVATATVATRCLQLAETLLQLKQWECNCCNSNNAFSTC